ncbi:MAG: NTP/NDP exchange transporter [Chlamydiota bacterium]|jgi:AAA family ATP:ADP antiporter
MSQTTQPEFGKWRSFLWPIHNFELKKLLPMFFMFFLISFNYTILRDTKDSLLVTAPGSGAEAIPFLKVWGVFPFAVLFMLIYAKLSNKLSKEKLFYATITPFLVFFAAFAFIIYPLRDVLHPTSAADTLQGILPEGFKGLIALLRNWTFSLFYIMAELWGSVALSLVFWGFANDIMKVSEAKRFYAVLGLGANLALPVSGALIVTFSSIRNKVPEGVDAWGVTLNYLMGLVVVAGIIVMGIYYWMNRSVLTDSRFYNPEEVKQKKKKAKMSMKESFAFLLKSRYIGMLAILVVAYGISINIVEVTWKSQLKLAYPNPNDYSAFMGKFSFMTGIITSFMMLFVGGNVVRRFGWKPAALVTPVILLVTGLIFFSVILFKDNLGGFIATMGTSPLMIAVVIGMIQNMMSKSCKYSLFDPTKEMAYIPLDQESKVKGKAAIDVVGARLGKSGGSLLQQGLILALGTIGAMTPYIAVILLAIIGVWIFAVRSLNKQFLDASAKREAEANEESQEKETATEKAALKEEATTSAS